MIDILPTLEGWFAEGLRVALARVVAVEGSAPRLPGSSLAVNDRGEVAGSVSGGCVDGAVYEEAQMVLAGAAPRLVRYGIGDDDAISVGLTCGGEIDIFVELADPAILNRVASAVAARAAVALVTHVAGERLGSSTLASAGDVGFSDKTGIRTTDRASANAASDGASDAPSAEIFVHAFVPEPEMYIFGAIDFSRAMARAGKFLGYRVSVVDARPIFATHERMPDADDVVVAWPDEFLRAARVDARTAIVVLTHDLKFDVPLLEVALETDAGFIGAMGSRRTHERRIAALRERGIAEVALARISGPVGLDIGAHTPEETAVSIAAEIVALRTGRLGGRLTAGSNPIHPVTDLRMSDAAR